MSGNAVKLILGIVVTVAVAAGLWRFFAPSQVITTREGPSGCTRPAELAAVDDRTLKVAASQLGKIAGGELNLEQNSEVVKLLSDNNQNLLVFDYLMCEAKARGEYDPAKPDQAKRVQTINAFLATNPTAAQFIELQKLLQETPTARLVVPDLTDDNGKQVLALTEPVQSISLLNAGKADMSAWVRNDSPGRLMVTPRAPSTVKQNEHVDVEVALLAPPATGPWKLRIGSSATNDESAVEVRVAAAGKLAELLEEVATEIENRVADAPDVTANQAGAPATAQQAAAGAQWLADRTHAVVRRKYPQASEEVAWGVSGALLEQMNWNGPAVAAYRNARVSLGTAATELDVPLSRALVLANVAAEPTRGEKSPADVLGHEEVDLAHLSSLKLASQNALVVAKPQAAQRLADALASKPTLASFAFGLKGDVALANSSPEAAVKAFDACAQTNAAPSCTLRKAEAQVASQDMQAAKVTLATVAVQTPVATQPVARRIAVDAARVATAH